MTKNPYEADLGGQNALAALRQTPDRIRALLASWTPDRWERSYAPGKWSARQIVIHLLQAELVLTSRVRFAVSQHGYTAQAFDQDAWLPIDDSAEGPAALDAYTALRKVNLALFSSLTPEQRTRSFTHPEYADLTADWVAAQLAGHDIHHLKQLEEIR